MQIRLILAGVILVASQCSSVLAQSARHSDTSQAPPLSSATNGSQNSPPNGGTIYGYRESFALLLAAGDTTGSQPRLTTVATDVRAIGDALQTQGFKVESRSSGLTQAVLEPTLRRFLEEHGSEDSARLLIYFVGHATVIPREGSPGELYLLPTDADGPALNTPSSEPKGLAARELLKMLDASKARHVLLVLDTCYAGAISATSVEPAPLPLSPLTMRKTRQIITSTSAEQLGIDNSRFRKRFVAGIKGGADRSVGEQPKDGYVTAQELAVYLSESSSSQADDLPTSHLFVSQSIASAGAGDFLFKPVEGKDPRLTLNSLPPAEIFLDGVPIPGYPSTPMDRVEVRRGNYKLSVKFPHPYDKKASEDGRPLSKLISLEPGQNFHCFVGFVGFGEDEHIEWTGDCRD